jgi:Zn-dependent peptidase ImmA (M78 family)
MRIGVTKNSSPQESSEEGEAVSQALELGAVPALTLPSVLEEQLNTLVLYVDAAPGVSGAACQLGPFNTIIINRREIEGRRSFDLGHEFFHLLTWAEMPPRHLEVLNEGAKSEQKIESLADSFSSGLLMPRASVHGLIEQLPMPLEVEGLASWILELASRFHVSGQALKWRLVNLGILKAAVAKRIDGAAIRITTPEGSEVPARFSKRFVETLGWGIESGNLSVRKTASVVGTTIDDLADLFAEHGLKTPFDL